MNKTPYLKKDGKIKRFEDVKKDDIQQYNELVNHHLCHDIINYIVEVKHSNNLNDKFNEILPIIKFNTPYRTFASILKNLL